MTLLGAKVGRERRRAKAKSEAQRIEDSLTLEQAKIGCELGLLFMLWHVPRHREDRDEDRDPRPWYQICVEEMVKYPENGYRYLWWWSLRMLGRPEKGKTLAEELDEMRSYFHWKFEQVNGRPIAENEKKL